MSVEIQIKIVNYILRIADDVLRVEIERGVCCVFLFILTAIPLADNFGQNTSLNNLIDCVELQYGADNLLVNGRPYTPSHPKAEGHPYFKIKEWKPGKVYINGNSFSVNNLKYNLSNYQLIIKHERPNGTTYEVVLSELLVDSFQIEEHLFVNRGLILPEKENIGYLEKIFVEKLSFFRLQKKVFGSLSNNKPYGAFSNQKDVFYLFLGDKHYKVTQKKEFIACFPDGKVQIKKYMKNHSLKWKKMTNNQFAELLKFCDDQI